MTFLKNILVAVFFLVAMSTATASEEWTWHSTADGAHPDQHEQHLMWLMNRARQNPAREGEWLADSENPQIAIGRTQFKVSLRKLRKQFRKIAPTPPAAFDSRLYAAALKHSRWMIRKDKQSHRGQMKSIKRSGFAWKECRASVFAYATSTLNAHAAFNIDWGKGLRKSQSGIQRGAGHRKALMASEQPLSHIGLSAIEEHSRRTRVGPWVVTANYCSPQTDNGIAVSAQLVGTVFVDQNRNGEFDPGEGLPGVRVSPQNGRWYAITAAGGGYAVPVTTVGTLDVTFSGGGINAYRTQVSVGRENVLLDYRVGDGVGLRTVTGVSADGGIEIDSQR